jgi:hypothetical protein
VSTTAIVILVAVAVAAALVITQRKKKGKTNSKPAPGPWVPPVVADNPPTTIKPEPVGKPPEPVLLDRNRKSPGDPGYDPRAVRPDPEFSPIEPQGTFWGEGVFDPAARYIDLNGKFHNAG